MDLDRTTLAWLVVAAIAVIGLPAITLYVERRRRERLRRRGIKRYHH